MKDIILTYTVEIIYPKRIQDLESQVLNNAIIVKTWEHGIAKQCNISKLGMPSLEQKSDTFQKLVCQVLTIIFLCSCLGKPSHENHNSFLGLMLKLVTPNGFKTWKAKS